MNFKQKWNKDDVANMIDIWKNKTKQIKERTILLKERITDALSHLSKEGINEQERVKALRIGGGILAAVVVCGAAVLLLQPTGYALQENGKTLGYIESPKALDEAVTVVEKQLGKTTGIKEILFADDRVTCTATKERNIQVLNQEELQKLLMGSDLMQANAWTIRINDKVVLAVNSEKAARQILDGVAGQYQSADAQVLDVAYREAVGIAKEKVQVDELTSVEEGTRLLITGQKEPKAYTVQDGDTIWDIAVANGLSQTELQQMNPGFDPEKIKIGQVINLVAVHPYLTVVTTELVASNENVPYGVVYEKSDSLYKGQSKVKMSGTYGVQKITSQLVKENGAVLTASVVSTEMVTQPQAEVVYQGTRSISSFTGTGTLSKPVPVHVSSPFGSRGSGRHTGVDLRNPKGTPIKAADDGVVTFAGNSGTYGNLVKLSHGNGLETWYAHCDTLNVSTGQVVSKGQLIATVGMTGRATGYHVHFEVRKNGVPQNPLNYL